MSSEGFCSSQIVKRFAGISIWQYHSCTPLGLQWTLDNNRSNRNSSCSNSNNSYGSSSSSMKQSRNVRACLSCSRCAQIKTTTMYCHCSRLPTRPFTISEPQDRAIGEFYVVQEGRVTDFQAPKLLKSRSGSSFFLPEIFIFSGCLLTKLLLLHQCI